MARTFETLVVFGTDNAGLERLLRFVQAALQVLASYPLLLAALLSNYPTAVHVSTVTALSQLQGRLGLTRRWLRLFRFLGSFQSGWLLYVSDDKDIQAWLHVLGKSSLGMYGLLESATLLDLLQVDHFQVFGMERTRSLNQEAQIFWFVALCTSAFASAIELLHVFAYRPVPLTGSGYGTGEGLPRDDDDEDDKKAGRDGGEIVKNESTGQAEAINELKREKDIAQKQKEDSVVPAAEEASRKVKKLGAKILADVLDMTIPCAAVGWLEIDAGLVGIAMSCSTVITGLDVWAECGRKVQRSG